MSNASPFQTQLPDQPPPQSNSKWLFLGAGAMLAFAGLCVACCGGLMYFGTDVFAEQVHEDLENNPVIIEHLGTLESVDVDWPASLEADGVDEYVFNLQGANANGKVQGVVITIDADTESVESGTLETSDGQKHDLFPESL